MAKLLLFDVDGTLVHAPGGIASFERAFTIFFNRPVQINPNNRSSGQTDMEIVTAVLNQSNVLSSEIVSSQEKIITLYVEDLIKHTEWTLQNGHVMPGVVDLLESIHTLPDITVSILSGGVRKAVEWKLNVFGLSHFFDWSCAAFGSDSPNRNDLPKYSLQRFHSQIKPSEVVVIGDTPKDIECAHKFGSRVFAVATGKYSLKELSAFNPDYVSQDLSDKKLFLSTIMD